MATYLRNRSQPFILDSPDFDDLEIRCTWSGEYEEEANLRISLEVRCVPNTRLQLLNTRDANVFFNDAFSERSTQGLYHSDDQDEADTPQSPLFGFSPLVRDEDNGAGLIPDAENTSDVVGVSEDLPISEIDEPIGENDSIQHGRRTDDTEQALRESVSLGHSASPCVSFPKPENSPRPRKRSATDADLTDSGSEQGDKSRGILQEIPNCSPCRASPVRSTLPGERMTPRAIVCPISPSKPKLTRTPGLAISNENFPTGANKSSALDAAIAQSQRLQKFTGSNENHSLLPSLISKPVSPQHSETFSSPDSVETVVGLQNMAGRTSCNNAALVDRTDLEIIRRRWAHYEPANSQATIDASREPRIISDQTVESLASADNAASAHAPHALVESNGYQRRTDPEEPELSDQPEVKLVEGLVVLENSENVQPATFKVTITASIFLQGPNEKGWSDLIIPGLPRTGVGKSGFFLFLMPSRHGLEIRTTSAKRAKMVENCFIAEFANAGNLVIPLRRCDREFYGEVSDYTVDQEVVAHSAFKTVASDSRTGSPKFEIRYHAMCSIKLHNRCFWTDKCCITLYIDGGPEGVYRCDLTSQKGGLKKIHIMANEYAEIGVSSIQVTCAPADLEKLCVAWTMSGLGREAGYWLPRIYSTFSRSRERSRDSLRYSLLDVLDEHQDSPLEDQSSESGSESHADPLQSNDFIEPDPNGIKGRPIQKLAALGWKWPKLSHIERSVHLKVIYYTWNPNYFMKQVLVGVLCLAFLGFGYMVSARSSLHSYRQSPFSGSHTHLQLTERTDQIWSETPGEPVHHGQGGVEDQSSAEGLSTTKILDKYRVPNEDEDSEPGTSESQGELEEQSMGAGPGVEESADSSTSFRDKIDYWLGWMGPLE
ncbi:hypothetical protein BJX61DRAFT_334980 [Aspergillus egyptiacus]|nr:hypothetical protein BJX61DRAFT_334980 [Aspergillus egyptiacus]